MTNLPKASKLKILMKLPKVLVLFSLVFAFLFLIKTPSFADCDLDPDTCLSDLGGTCKEGTTISCGGTIYECISSLWDPNTNQNQRPNYVDSGYCDFDHPEVLTQGYRGSDYWDHVTSTWVQPNTQAFQQAVEAAEEKGEVNDTGWVLRNFNQLAHSIGYEITGPTLAQAGTSGWAWVPGGAIGGTVKIISALYQPPASSVEYFADLGRRLNLVKPAYAQGVGFEGMRPILGLWKAFRNVAYLFFTIIFVIIGFAIMFRLKLDPQTVVSIQNAIPRVVVALLLVTFSYAIAGLLIDIMYLLIFLAVTVISSSGLISAPEIDNLRTQFTQGGFLDLADAVFSSTTWGIWGAFAAIGAAVGTAIGFIAGNVVGAIAGFFTGAVLTDVIVAVIILYSLFKLLIELIKAYVSIILAVIFGPLQIMLNVLPGQNTFGAWAKNLFANIAVFPAVAAFVLIAKIMISTTDDLWRPPFVGAAGAVTAGLISFGMLLLLPKIPTMVKEALKTKPLTSPELPGFLGTGAKAAALYPVQSWADKSRDKYDRAVAASRAGGGTVSPGTRARGAIAGVLKTTRTVQ